MRSYDQMCNALLIEQMSTYQGLRIVYVACIAYMQHGRGTRS